MRTAVVVNPSKVTDLPLRREDIRTALAAAGCPEPLWWETTADDPGGGQTREAIDAGVEVVLVYGGDGTVMACATELADTKIALAVLPAGTGNLLATNVDLPADLADAVACAVGAGRRRIDVGALDTRRFTVMAGIGLDAAMLDHTSDTLKATLGPVAYAVSGLRRLLDRPMRVTVHLDDLPPLVRRARTVLVANVGRLQAGIELFPDARPDDGLLDVAILRPRGLGDWMALAWGVMRRSPRVRRMETFQARRIRVTSDRAHPREIDGDVIEPGAVLLIEVRPAALTLCVPE